MKSLVAMHLTEDQLEQAGADPIIEIARDIAGLFPDLLDSPKVKARFYVVAVPRDRVDFVGVMAPPAPRPAPSFVELRRAAWRALRKGGDRNPARSGHPRPPRAQTRRRPGEDQRFAH